MALEKQLEFEFIEKMRKEDRDFLITGITLASSVTAGLIIDIAYVCLKASNSPIIQYLNKITEKWPDSPYGIL